MTYQSKLITAINRTRVPALRALHEARKAHATSRAMSARVAVNACNRAMVAAGRCDFTEAQLQLAVALEHVNYLSRAAF